MFKRSLFIAVSVLAGLLAFAAPSNAQNLLTNPGFETGDLTGWTDGGNTGWNSVSSSVPHSGQFHISNGAVGSFSLLQQTLATVPGMTYDVSGWLMNDGGGLFQILWNGNVLASDSFTSHGYQQFSGSAIGTGSDTVAFGFRDDPGFVQFDDASVVAAVPEPGSISLLSVGITSGLGLLLLRRRKRRA
jgi:hypothetical protein